MICIEHSPVWADFESCLHFPVDMNTRGTTVYTFIKYTFFYYFASTAFQYVYLVSVTKRTYMYTSTTNNKPMMDDKGKKRIMLFDV